MDVNKANAVSPVGQGGPRKDARRETEDHRSDDDSPDGQGAESPWDATEAYAVDGLLAGALSPEAREVFQALAAEIEPLRAELDKLRGLEAHYKELAERHPFLPVPDRREFLRELNHVLGHMANLTPAPGLVVLHLANGDDIRRRHGRAALDAALAEACRAIDASLHPTDVLGSLGGNDFGVILLIGADEMVDTKMQAFVTAVEEASFAWNGHAVPLEVRAGMTTLVEGWTVENAVAAADRDLLGRAGGASATDTRPRSGDDVGQ